MQNGVRVDSLGTVQQRDDERYDAVVGPHPTTDHERASIAKEARLDDVECRYGRRIGVGAKYTTDSFQDSFRVVLQIPEGHREIRHQQRCAQQLGVDAILHPQSAMDRGHRERAQLAGRREGIGYRPPHSAFDIATYGMRKTERDVGIVAIDDHGREHAVQRLPLGRIAGECGESRKNLGPVLRNVAAVQPQALPADLNGCVRIHGLECALRAVRIGAQLPVKIVVNGQYESRRHADPVAGYRGGRQAGVPRFDR